MSARIKTLASGETDAAREEISKCELLCANCHRIRTAQSGVSVSGSHKRRARRTAREILDA